MSMPFVKGSIGKEICTGYRPEGVPCRLGGRNGGGPPSSIKREEDHGELMIRESTLPLKGRGFQLVYIARRHHSIPEGESEIEGVFGIGYGDSKWEAMPRSIP